MRKIVAKLVVAIALVAGVGAVASAPAVASPRSAQSSTQQVRPADWTWMPH